MQTKEAQIVRSFLMNNASKKYLFVDFNLSRIKSLDLELLDFSDYTLLNVVSCYRVDSEYRSQDIHYGYVLKDSQGNTWNNQYPNAVYPIGHGYSVSDRMDYTAINAVTGQRLIEVGYLLNQINEQIHSVGSASSKGKAKMLEDFYDSIVRQVSHFGGIVSTNCGEANANHFIVF